MSGAQGMSAADPFGLQPTKLVREETSDLKKPCGDCTSGFGTNPSVMNVSEVSMQCPSGSGIRVSQADSNQYRQVRLDNGLVALVVSDEKADKAAASLSVHVGHLQDPVEISGLAHFLEHMLFLGTEKYPEEGEYKAFLKNHGGGSNASTGPEHTTYHFFVHHAHLEPALDRFAQFFVAPLLTEDGADREMNAVDSEFRRNLQSDPRRMYQLQKLLARPGHPYNRFGTGNLTTLRDEPTERGLSVHDALRAFYREYYSANIMRLCVVGRDSLDSLEHWVRDKFAGVRNINRSQPTIRDAGLPFTPTELARKIWAVPVRDIRELKLVWPVPTRPQPDYAPPSRLLGHLLGHEGPGSLLAHLKQTGYATGLTAGGSTNTSFSLFEVTIMLTPLGESQADDVVRLVFAAIARLREAPIEQWRWDEMRRVADTQLRFQPHASPWPLAQTISRRLHYFTPEEVLTQPFRLGEFDPEPVEHLLRCLTPPNMLLFQVGQASKPRATSTERWYGTPWGWERLSSDLLASWGTHVETELVHEDGSEDCVPRAALGATDPTGTTVPRDSYPLEIEPDRALQRPPVNEYIPSNLQLCVERRGSHGEHSFPAPRLLIDSGGRMVRLWYRGDDRFQDPRGSIFLSLLLPEHASKADTPEARVRRLLWVRVVSDVINESFYDATIAGLDYAVQHQQGGGLQVLATGFSDKLGRLAVDVCKEINAVFDRSSQPSPPSAVKEAFERQKERLDRSLANQLRADPLTWASLVEMEYLSNSYVGVWESVSALRDMSIDDMYGFSEDCLPHAQFEAFAYGNFSEGAARDIVADMVAACPQSVRENDEWETVFEPRLLDLPQGTEFQVTRRHTNPDDVNSAVHFSFLLGPLSYRTTALAQLLQQLLNQPFFQMLRTQEQLGYIVHSNLEVTMGTVRLLLRVQSASHSVLHVEERMRHFLGHFRSGVLDPLAEEHVAKVSEILQHRALEPDKRQAEELSRLWKEIKRGSYRFECNSRIAEELATLDKASILDFFDSYIAEDAPHRRSFVTRVVSLHPTAPDNRELDPERMDDVAPPCDGEGSLVRRRSKERSLEVPSERDRVVARDVTDLSGAEFQDALDGAFMPGFRDVGDVSAFLE